LDRVSGVGAGLLTLIAPHVVQSLDTTRSRSAAGRTTAGRAVATQPAAPRSPSIPVVRVPTVRMVREQPKRGGKAAGPIDLNSASENDLMTLAGIGPARARAIVAFRQKNGPFASVAELEKVPGITPKLRRRLEAQVVVR
jgi:competence ComEA-like helix-hairpin-helix protein